MKDIEPAALLTPVSEDAPCGPNMEYDAAFGELERAAQGTPERVVGDKVVAQAEDPDWGDVFSKAHALFAQTKDLRVATHLLHAGMRSGGLPQLAGGLALIRGMLTQHWGSVHPELDKDDNDDPTLRKNSLVVLNDRAGVLGALLRCPLIQSRTLGRVTLRDVRIAAGELTASPNEPPPLEAAHVDAAFMDGELAELTGNHAAVQSALQELSGISSFLNEQVGAASAPDFAPLQGELKVIARVLSEQLARRGVGEASTDEPAAGNAPRAAAASGEIATREDVVRALDKLCDYFQKYEPSSPVPLLLRRAQRLVAKDFMEILRDLTPDGVQQAMLIGGLREDQ
jgi:type VI secretion system protein ImpA